LKYSGKFKICSKDQENVWVLFENGLLLESSQSEQVDEDSRIDYVADEESLSEHPPHRRQTSTRFYDDLSQDSFLDVEKFKGALKTYGAADTLIQCFDSNKFSYTDLNVLQMAFTE